MDEDYGLYNCYTVRKMTAEIKELEKQIEQLSNDNHVLKTASIELEKENAELKAQDKEQVNLIETQYAENQTLGNNNAKLLHLYGECKNKNKELKSFCAKLIKANNELRKSLRKYEIVPDVDYLPNGLEVYKENVGNNPYDIK